MIYYDKINSYIYKHIFKEWVMQYSEELENIMVDMDEEQKVRKSKMLKAKKIGNKEKRILKKEKL